MSSNTARVAGRCSPQILSRLPLPVPGIGLVMPAGTVFRGDPLSDANDPTIRSLLPGLNQPGFCARRRGAAMQDSRKRVLKNLTAAA